MTTDTHVTDEVMRRPYNRLLVRDPEGTYSARVLEFDGCFAGGDTPEEASTNLVEAMRLWVESELEQDHDIPEPYGSREYSGRLNFRMPASLHENAARRAEIERVSLNQLLVTAVSQYLGQLHPTGLRDNFLAASSLLARAAENPAAYWPYQGGTSFPVHGEDVALGTRIPSIGDARLEDRIEPLANPGHHVT